MMQLAKDIKKNEAFRRDMIAMSLPKINECHRKKEMNHLKQTTDFQGIFVSFQRGYLMIRPPSFISFPTKTNTSSQLTSSFQMAEVHGL